MTTEISVMYGSEKVKSHINVIIMQMFIRHGRYYTLPMRWKKKIL